MTVENEAQTKEHLIRTLSRGVVLSTERVTGDRTSYPLFVYTALKALLTTHGHGGRIFYGKAAFLAVENERQSWFVFGEKRPYFWIETENKETVDLNVFRLIKKMGFLGPPLIWSKDIPIFYKYVPEGLAEVDEKEVSESSVFQSILKGASQAQSSEEVVNEPIIFPDRKMLDSEQEEFATYEKLLNLSTVEKPPI